MRTIINGITVSLLVGGLLILTSGPAGAWPISVVNDFLTGGGFIIRGPNPATGPKANFGVGGGVKNGAFWGHLEYIDHGPNGPNVHWMTITAYYRTPGTTDDGTTHQPTGSREICGTARTDLYGDVYFRVTAVDKGEPGVDDIFAIKLARISDGFTVYSTEGDADHTLGGTGPGGGNIQLHAHNPSNSGSPTSACAMSEFTFTN